MVVLEQFWLYTQPIYHDDLYRRHSKATLMLDLHIDRPRGHKHHSSGFSSVSSILRYLV